MTIARIILSLAFALYGAVASISGLDNMSRVTPTLEAVVPWPFRAEAYRAAATLAIIREDAEKAKYEAARAVRYDPIDPQSAALLGRAHLLANEPGLADKAFRVAAGFGWRDIYTQLYWYSVAMTVGDYKVAMDRADATLRLRQVRSSESEVLAPLEETPEGARILAERIQGGPPWLNAYLDMSKLDIDDPRIDRIVSVMLAYPDNKTAVQCDQVAGLVRGLLWRDRRSAAVKIWNRYCPDQRVTDQLADLNMAKIASDEAGNPFGWRAIPWGDIVIEPAGNEAQSPVVVQSIATITRPILSHSLPQMAGHRILTITGSNLEVVEPKLECAREISRSTREVGSEQLLVAEFTVGDCSAQKLTLAVRPGNKPVSLHRVNISQRNN